MRSGEIALLLLVVAGAVRPLTRWARSARVAAMIATATLLVWAAHVLIEGARWQLTTLYLAAVVTIAVGVAAARRAPATPSGRRVAWFGVVGLAIVAAILGWALPIIELPAPSGPAAVGTTVIALRDEGRSETYGGGTSGSRELVVQVWYPAASARGGSPWLPDGRRFGRAAARQLGLPPFALDHLELIRAHASLNAPPSEAAGSFPVVVYSHGWGGSRSAQAGLAERLASEGYAVVALDHTFGAIAAVFPDGRVVPQDPAALPRDAPDAVYDAAARQLVATFARDLTFALDQLAAGAIPLLADRLALDRVALTGHSTGGGAAIAACAVDRRCGVVVAFDPWVEPLPDDTVGGGLGVPLLSLRSEEWIGNANDARLRRLHAASSGPTGLVSLSGASHRDFTLFPRFSPLARLVGLSGPAATETVHDAIAAWTVAFLDAHLRGTGLDPLERPPDLVGASLDG